MSSQTSSLLVPDALSAAHAEKMKFFLTQLILNQPEQKISFAEFMHHALYAPGLGYYAAGNRKFGAAGDFITAPELSPLFNKCIAQQIEEVISQLPEAAILEFGAGSGVMALEIMHYLAQKNSLPQKYYILEVSAELKHRQEQLILQKAPHLLQYFHWLTELPTIPLTGVIIANEVLDAMPCHRFSFKEGLIEEYYVTVKDNEFSWQCGPPNPQVLSRIIQLNLENYVEYDSEINLIQTAWIRSVSESLKQGIILLIDYGYSQPEYYHPQRNTGTLKCFFRHHHHNDPLILTGIQDITAHVNFTAIAQAAVENHLEIEGYVTQGNFLLNLGIDQLLHGITDSIELVNATQQLKKLTLPTEMGELFKVMALSRKIPFELKGFSQFSRLHSL